MQFYPMCLLFQLMFFLLAQIEAEKSQQSKSGGGKVTLGSIGKSNSVDGKISRSSLIRGGSQEDPQQLMRDLQDSIEREADIREQLKFAEEEAESLRTKVLRIEDENESLMVQLKKMATKARSINFVEIFFWLIFVFLLHYIDLHFRVKQHKKTALIDRS